jgi:pimeloyl-ACP methyl ester carboxylesterase
MATFMLIHGGAHGGWCYQRVAALLRSGGHMVLAPSLTGLADRKHLLSPKVDLETHITDVVNLLEYEELRDVVLVGHSYGGMVITGVADRVIDRIASLVFLDAAQPRNGESLADIAPAAMAASYRGMRVVDGVELIAFPDSPALQAMGLTDPADIAWLAAKATPHPWRCMVQKLALQREEAVLALHRASINCTATLKGREPEQRRRALDADLVFELDTGHDLMITEPEALARMLVEVSKASPARGRAIRF